MPDVRPSRLVLRRPGTNASSATSQICLPVSVSYLTLWVSTSFRVILVSLFLSSFLFIQTAYVSFFFFTSANSVRVSPPICLL